MRFKKPNFWDSKNISLWAILLLPISTIYLIVFFLIKFYKINFNQKHYTIPIICVGNIVVGGTGKTPLTIEIFKFLKLDGKKPAFIKKKYDYLIDEVEMLKKVGSTFVSGKNRKIAINNSISNGHNVVILDDGYQDFSLKPNFSVLCFNSKQLIGNGLLIPSGPMREKLNTISRANCIVINGKKNLEFENKILAKIDKKKIPIFYSNYKIQNLSIFKNKKITAFAGIGNPSNFFELLTENNLNVINTYSFPDHHNYSSDDFKKIIGDNSTKIVTTEKDYYRLTNDQKQKCECVIVELEIENKKKFEDLIKSFL